MFGARLNDGGQDTYGATVLVTLTRKLHDDDLLTLSNVMQVTFVTPRLNFDPELWLHDRF